jgi:hypothetical protein
VGFEIIDFGGGPVTADVIGDSHSLNGRRHRSKLRMNDSNPYEAPSTNSRSSPWRLIDFLVAGIWLAIPIGVFVGGRLLRPAFDDFGVDLDGAAQYLLRPYSAIPFTIASVVVLLAMFRIPQGSMRRRFVWLACTTGGAIGVACLLSLLVPLYSMWQDLR